VGSQSQRAQSFLLKICRLFRAFCHTENKGASTSRMNHKKISKTAFQAPEKRLSCQVTEKKG
jgi:hypothetical protein